MLRIKLNYGIIRSMKDNDLCKVKEINQSKIKEPGPGEEEKEEKEEKKDKRKPGRPTIFTLELKSKLIKLFEEHFFIAIVAAKSDIYKYHIYEWIKEHKDFNNAVTHAQDKWIAQEMEELKKDAQDKREKDWRARKYRLSIADIEYNDKKYLREEPGKRDSTQITIIIDRRDLKTSKEEALKIIGETKAEEETISLIPFEEGKKGKKGKKGDKKRKGEAET